MQQEFIKRIKLHEAIIKKHSAISSIVGYIKLFFVLLFCISLYHMFTKEFPTKLIIVGTLEFLILVVLWIYHHKLHEKIDYSSGIAAINKKHLERLSGKWVDFTDIGEEFIDPKHPYACDLDIVGQKSYFQFLNTTHTWYGRRAYANDLLQPQYSKAEISRRQEAVSELSADIDFSNHIEYHFSKIGTDCATQKLVDELKDTHLFIRSKVIKLILNYVPMLTFLFLTAIFIFRLNSLYLIGLYLVAIQIIIWVAGIPKTKAYLRAVSHLPHKLNAYSIVIETLRNRSFTSERLKEIQAQLGVSELSAERAIKELSKISDRIGAKHNAIIYFVLNALLLWDYENAIRYEEWKIKYAGVAESWFIALGDFESLLCFSNFPNLCGNASLPDIAGVKTIKAQQLGHPLIPNDIRINNDITCQDNIFIISGSNMSGKTTFLRTVGINLVLGRAGSFVCAKQMSFSLMEIITSMRIADDLNEGISTFYAELKRIKSIVELAEKEQNMIFLIDEIFRGTNSVDRLSGAKTVISKLNALNIMGIITTHDLELCEIADQYLRIKNYSFAEYYVENEIRFDYQIKVGKSNTTNAKYLMKMVGIL